MTLIESCIAFTGRQEGFCAWPYLDTESNVTIGFGIMCPTAVALANLFGLTSPAGIAPIAEQFSAVKSSEPGKCSGYYEQFSKIRMPLDRAQEIMAQRLGSSITQCRKRIPEFDALPIPVATAAVDIDYNVKGGIGSFPSFCAAVARGDWAAAAVESDRPQLPKRSADTRALILSVANAVS